MPQTIDPDTNETIFIIDTNEVSLAELINRPDIAKVQEGKTFNYPSFCIKNMSDTTNVYIKSQLKNWKGYPLEVYQAIAFAKSNPSYIWLSTEEGEAEIRILFV